MDLQAQPSGVHDNRGIVVTPGSLGSQGDFARVDFAHSLVSVHVHVNVGLFHRQYHVLVRGAGNPGNTVAIGLGVLDYPTRRGMIIQRAHFRLLATAEKFGFDLHSGNQLGGGVLHGAEEKTAAARAQAVRILDGKLVEIGLV